MGVFILNLDIVMVLENIFLIISRIILSYNIIDYLYRESTKIPILPVNTT